MVSYPPVGSNIQPAIVHSPTLNEAVASGSRDVSGVIPTSDPEVRSDRKTETNEDEAVSSSLQPLNSNEVLHTPSGISTSQPVANTMSGQGFSDSEMLEERLKQGWRTKVDSVGTPQPTLVQGTETEFYNMDEKTGSIHESESYLVTWCIKPFIACVFYTCTFCLCCEVQA
jgi:hypothetical protein